MARGKIAADRARWQEDGDRRASGRGGERSAQADGQGSLEHTSFFPFFFWFKHLNILKTKKGIFDVIIYRRRHPPMWGFFFS